MLKFMLKLILGLILFAVGIVGIMLIPSPQETASMPWEITAMPDGNLQVFDIHLGTSTYRQAQQQFKQYGKTAIFTQNDTPSSVEAYFDSLHLNGLSAKLIFNLAVEQEQIDLMLSDALEARLKPSGAHQYKLSNEANAKLVDAVITGITYIPSVKLDHEMIRYRFGEPDQITPLENEQTELWFYNNHLLRIQNNPNEKTIIQYKLVTP